MSIVKKFTFIFFVVALSSAKVSGQAARSPFTTFGLGEPYGNALIQNQGMGGIGISQPQYWFINNQNPALLVYNMNTVFQAGIVGESRNLRGDTLKQRSANGNLNYLATAFPIMPGKWSTAVGLMPYTTVNYELVYSTPVLDPNGNAVNNTFVQESGTGGISQFYWSNGVRLNRQFSIGLKAAYIFGPVETNYSSTTPNTEQPFPYLINIKEKTLVKDFLFSGGLSYVKDSLGGKNDYRLSVGSVYTFGSKIRASRRAETTRSSSAGGAVDSVTLFDRRGNIEIPGAITFGVSIARGSKWSIGTEFNYQDWSTFKSINQDEEGLGKSWRAALGGELTPDGLAFDNYLKRITYRVGLSYERMPFLTDTPGENIGVKNPVNDFGINFGLSLPAGRSSLDFAFKVGKRGNRSENIVDENYFKLYFGLTFNDQWFIRRKFD